MTSRDSFTPLAITGLGCLFPGKPGTRGFWNTVLQGIDQIREIPDDRWRPSDHFDPDPSKRDMVYAARGAFLSPVPFSPAEYGITPSSLEATDTAQLLGLHVARQALLDAGYAALPRDAGRPLPRDRASVIVGVTSALELLIPLGARLDHPRWRRAMREAGVPEDRINDALSRIAASYPEWTEDSFPGLLGNVVAGRIASRFDLHGTNCVVDAACASSLAAVHQAAMELQSGRADIVVTGGIDTFTDVFMYACFSKTPALSKRGEARPFAADADGTILGEGIGLVVLKRLADAQRDGDRIHAVLRGLGTSSDGRGQAIYAPGREGQLRAVRRAWSQAGVGATDIGLVEGHGTGTKAGDGVELAALLELFGTSGPAGPWCALGSVKSQIGHAKGAAGAAGLVKATLALKHRVLPPTLKAANERPELLAADAAFFMPARARHWPAPTGGRPRRAAVSAFGFGGSNFHAVLEETTHSREAAWDGSVEILAWSGSDLASLDSVIDSIPDPESAEFSRLARQTRSSFDPKAPARLAVAWSSGDRAALQAACRDALAAARSGRPAVGPARAGTGAGPRKPVLLFPGQGSQKTGMFRELACVFPEIAESCDAAATAFSARFPALPALDRIVDPLRAGSADILSGDTRACQSALAAIGLGSAHLLERFGVNGWAACGHSLGELPALAWAGRITPDSMHRLVALRGGAMHDAGQAFAGAMIAAMDSREKVMGLLAADRSLSEVAAANHNSAGQMVLSGPVKAIEAASRVLSAGGVRVVRLDVAGAFHHPALAPVGAVLGSHLAAEPLHGGSDRVVLSGCSGAPYPVDATASAALLARQPYSEIRFVSCLEWLRDAGADLFIECGPGKVLTGLSSRVCDAPTVCIDPDPEQPGGLLRLARALCQLAALGLPVRLEAWESPAEELPVATGMTVPLSGANYKKPRPVIPPLPALNESRSNPVAARPEEPRAMSAPHSAPAAHASLAREAMGLLARMHEDNARLHRQFLETQESAQRALMALVEGRAMPAMAQVVTSPRPAAPLTVPAAPVAAMAPAQPVYVAPAPVASFVTAPAPVAVPTKSAGPDILGIVRLVISDKTGYPVDALGEDLALDADLGIDSIKRVEIMAGVQERLPDAPVIGPELMGTLRTLRQLVDHLSGGAAHAPAAQSQPQSVAASNAPASSTDSIMAVLRSVISDKTGYPTDALGENLALDADLGIDSIKRVEILAGVQEQLPEAPTVSPDQMGTLRTLRQLATHLSGSTSVASAPVTPEKKTTLERHELNFEPWTPVPGPILLPAGSRVLLAGDHPDLVRELQSASNWRVEIVTDPSSIHGPFDGLILFLPKMPGLDLACQTVRWLQAARAGLTDAGRRGAALLVGVVQLDGAWGGDGGADTDLGLLAGAVKTAGREWPGVSPRLIDCAAGVSAALLAQTICRANTPAEVGLSSSGHVAGVLRVVPSPAHGRWPLERGDTVVVTGGGRGVTTEVALGMARTMPLRFVLVGRTALEVEPVEFATLADEPALVRALISSGLALPAARSRAARLLAGREVARTMARLQAAGSVAEYISADISDLNALTLALRPKLDALKPVRAVVHGAGVLADARIESKTMAEVERVWNPKIKGLENILRLVPPEGLGALVLFGSITGRLGRVGQLDYAMANAALACRARSLSRRHPACKVVAVDWGPWRGGMVDGTLARLFDAEGVGLIEPESGGDFLANELASYGPAEVMALAAGSRLPEDHQPVVVPVRDRAEWTRPVAMATHRFLEGHMLDGRAVLPFAVAVEWMAHTALHARPGQSIVEISDLQVLKGVVLEKCETIHLEAVTRSLDNDSVSVALRSQQDRPGMDRFRATVRLGDGMPAGSAPSLERPTGSGLAVDHLYGGRLFHGAEWRMIETVEVACPGGIVAKLRPAPAPARLMDSPLRGRWIIDPWALDGLFQAAILCSQERGHAGCLPSRVARMEITGKFGQEGCLLVMRVVRAGEHGLVADAEFLDAFDKVIARVTGLECTIDPSLARAFQRSRPRAAGTP